MIKYNLGLWQGVFFNRFLFFIAAAVGFSVPASTAMLNILFGIFLILFVLGFNLKLFSDLVRDPIVFVPICIFLWLLFSQIFGGGDQGLVELSKSRKLLFFIPVILVFISFPNFVTWAFKGFFFASFLILFLSVFCWVSGYPVFGVDPNNAVVFKNHITQNFLMAFFAYCCAEFFMRAEGMRRVFLGAVVILAVLNILFMVQGRIGYLALVVGFVVFVVRHFKPKWWGAFFIAALVVVVLLLLTKNSVSDRVQLGVMEMAQCAVIGNGNVNYCAGTSMGLRLYMYNEAIKIFFENPFFGSGVGSVEIPPIGVFSEIHNPHNEFLMILVQQGIVGFSLWIGWIFLIFKRIFHVVDCEEQSIFFAGMWMFLMGCVFNSFFRDMTEGHAFILLVSAIVATSYRIASTNVSKNRRFSET